MAQFVLLIDGATSEQLESILRIEAESDGHLLYIPLVSETEGVTTRSAIKTEMHASTTDRSEIYRGIRIEWDDFGVAGTIRVLKLFPFGNPAGPTE